MQVAGGDGPFQTVPYPREPPAIKAAQLIYCHRSAPVLGRSNARMLRGIGNFRAQEPGVRCCARDGRAPEAYVAAPGTCALRRRTLLRPRTGALRWRLQ